MRRKRASSLRKQVDEARYMQFYARLRRRLADRIRAKLRELLPAVANALAPPDSENSDFEALGATSDEIRGYALDGLNRRLNVIGVPLDSL